jgi:hypothetical protein
VIYLDSNIPMHLIGADDRLRGEARRLLERAITDREKLVTSAVVLQEILHRYVAIGRRDAIQPAFDAITGVVDEVFDIGLADVERARHIIQSRPKLSARHALHLATMERQRVGTIMSFDTGFDGYPGIVRIGG